jgi:Transposase DDE domain
VFWRERGEGVQDPFVTTDLNTLLTALYVKIDDEIGRTRWLGRPPLLTDSELVCLAVAQALLGFRSEARWLRFANAHLRAMFPYLPLRPGYNRRLRAALPLVKRVIRDLAVDSDFWFDGHWIADSTPVPCAMSRPAVKRSELAGWANYGYCASHSRFFWGLRLYLVCTPAGMPILWALADPKIGEREVLAAMLEVDAGLIADRPGILLICDKGFASRQLEHQLAGQGITLLRPSRKDEKQRHGEPMLKKVRQLIESVNDTLKGQLDLEQHGGRTFEGVAIRVAQRILAMAAAIWHNNKTGAPITRSLIAFDH